MSLWSKAYDGVVYAVVPSYAIPKQGARGVVGTERSRFVPEELVSSGSSVLDVDSSVAGIQCSLK